MNLLRSRSIVRRDADEVVRRQEVVHLLQRDYAR
jgi:hypothetical protein